MLLLLLGPVADDHLAGDPVVGAEQGAEGGRGAPELETELDLLDGIEAEAAIALRQGVAEEPHLARLLAKETRHRIRLFDLILARNHLAVDESAHGVADVFEVLRVQSHASNYQ